MRINTKGWGRKKRTRRSFFHSIKSELIQKIEEKPLIGKITFSCPPEFYYEMNGKQYTNGEIVNYYGDSFELKAYDERFNKCIIATRSSADATVVDYAIHKGIYNELKNSK